MTGVRRQARGEQRRQEILDAAIRLIARDGTHAVTHRAVASEAGCSTRATTYYFESKQDLLTEAFLHYAQLASARFDDVVTAAGEIDTPTAAAMLATIVADDVENDRAGLVTEYELVLEITRNPALEKAYAQWQARLEALLATAAQALGSETPEVHARLTLAAVRGLELEALSRPSHTVDRADLESLFATMLAGLTPQSRRGARARR